MNKLYGHGSKGAVLALILEPGNIEKLTHGQPIELDLTEGPWERGLPPKIQLVIAYSETPVTDAKRITEQIGAEKVLDLRTPVTAKKRPHCTECKSSIEQIMVWRQEGAPWITCCGVCGAAFGVMAPMPGIKGEKL